MEDKIFTISEYIDLVNRGLKEFSAKIIGEVSEISIWATGHVSFYLKDEKDKSVINCIIWKSRYQLYGIELKEGDKIIATGYPEMWPPTGRLSFKAEVIEYAGEGTLKKEYEKLKKKLTEEGIFEVSKKRTIPSYPQKIGVITSLKGAVMADFSNNLGKFGFKIKIIDSRVEGQTAVSELLLSIKTFKKQDIEVLVIMRGGGSLESMMPFNNEILVREIANFPVPIIAGIGHHKDEPLVALAADISVSTPTASANLLNESWKQAALFLERDERSIVDGYENILQNANLLINKSIDIIHNSKNLIVEKYKRIENKIKISFQNFSNILDKIGSGIDNLLDKSFSGLNYLILTAQQNLKHAEKIILINNPERQLNLGYTIAFSSGKIIRSTGDVKIGENIDLRVTDGKIISQVKNINTSLG